MDDLDKLLLNKGIAAMLPKREEEKVVEKKFRSFFFRVLNYEITLLVSVDKRR